MQAAVSRRKRRACRRHCFFTGKDGSFGRCFSCHSTMYIHGSLQNWRYIFRFFPSPVALLARFAFAFACLKNNKPPFLQACCLSYSYAECCGSLFGFMPSCWFLEIWASRHSYDCYVSLILKEKKNNNNNTALIKLETNFHSLLLFLGLLDGRIRLQR